MARLLKSDRSVRFGLKTQIPGMPLTSKSVWTLGKLLKLLETAFYSILIAVHIS